MDSIDLLNIYSIKMKSIPGESGSLSISIYCNDFNEMEYELKGHSKEHGKKYVKQLRSLALEQPRRLTALLWYTLSRKYPLNQPADWYRCEAHWLKILESFHEQPVDCPGKDANTSLIRMTQCNESYQLCSTLPTSFFVPKDLQDFILINKMSTVIKDHRVPVISYCCPIDYRRHFIIRCASFDTSVYTDNNQSVFKLLSKMVKPLAKIDVDQLVVSHSKLENAHKKLRSACRSRVDDDKTKKSSNNYAQKIHRASTSENSSSLSHRLFLHSSSTLPRRRHGQFDVTSPETAAQEKNIKNSRNLLSNNVNKEVISSDINNCNNKNKNVLSTKIKKQPPTASTSTSSSTSSASTFTSTSASSSTSNSSNSNAHTNDPTTGSKNNSQNEQNDSIQNSSAINGKRNHFSGQKSTLKSSFSGTLRFGSKLIHSPSSIVVSSGNGSRNTRLEKRDENVKFLSKIGRWLHVISQTLKLAKSISRTVLQESSVLLVESDDRRWNCVLSSLVQILLDPHARTVAGFESLLSKEWIYLCGHASRGLHNCNQTNLLFIVFLDCVYQIYSQNNRRFEFTSEYLKFLFESLFKTVPPPTQSTGSSSLNHSDVDLEIGQMSLGSFSIIAGNPVTKEYHGDRQTNNYDSYKIFNPFYTPQYDTILSAHSTVRGNNESIRDNNDSSFISSLSSHSRQSTTKSSGKAVTGVDETSTPKLSSISSNSGKVNSGVNGISNGLSCSSQNGILINGNTTSINNSINGPQMAPQSPALELSDHIADMRLWSDVYLRWQPNRAYCCPDEYIYFCSY